MGFSGIFGSLVDISRSLILVEFGRVLRLVDLSKFFGFWF